jgi:hypothetical protein
MRCSCDQARREARAEAFREAARWHETHARMIARDFGHEDEAGHIHRDAAAHFLFLAGSTERAALSRGDWSPFGSHPSPAPERAPSTPPSAATEDDGFITVHATDWPDNPMEGGAM